MYPRSQERRRNREATVYLPALGGAGLGASDGARLLDDYAAALRDSSQW